MPRGGAEDRQRDTGLAITLDPLHDLVGRAAGREAFDPRRWDRPGEPLGAARREGRLEAWQLGRVDGMAPLRTVRGRDPEFSSPLTRITISLSIGTDRYEASTFRGV
jgi:hypothetical protein